MNKKLFSLGLVMALLFALTIPAGAVTDSPADNDAASVENDHDGSGASENAPASEEGTAEEAQTAEMKPDVQFPDTMRIVFNPYRMNAVWNGESTNDTVLSETVFISNCEAVPVQVSLSVSGVPVDGSAAIPASSPEELGGDTKQAFIWFEFRPFIEGEEPIWNGVFTGAENQIAVNCDEGRTVVLPAAQNGGSVRLLFKAFGEFYIPDGKIWTADDIIQFYVRCRFNTVGESESAECFDVAEPIEDAEASDDAQRVENVQSPEDVEASDDEEPVENAEPSDVAEPVEDAEPSDVAEPVEDAEPSEDTEPSDVAEPVEDAEPSDVAEPVEDTEPSDVAEPVEDAEPSEDTEPSDVAEPVENAQTSEDEEPVEDAEASDDTEPVEDAELSDNTEPVEDAEASDDTEPVEDAEASEITEFVEDVELSDDIQSDEDAEPFDDTEPAEEPTDFSQD